MTENERQLELREAMIEALLESAYDSDSAANERRIENVMNRLETVEIGGGQAAIQSPPRNRSRRLPRWISLAVAVSVLVTLVVVFQATGSSGYALATVNRSIAAARELFARRYSVTVTVCNASQGAVDIKSDLYVEGNKRFALRHPALIPGTSIWLGSDGNETWIVPAIGPVRVGDETALGRWVSQQQQLSTPYLHVSTILARMAQGYRLEKKSIVILTRADGTVVECQHIIGHLKSNRNDKLPDTISLWADVETGVAQRVEAIWNLSANESGHQKIVIELVESHDLSDDWFTAEGHYSGNRRKLRLDSDD